MVHGYFRDRGPYAPAPYVAAVVVLQRTSNYLQDEFLIDTGADDTVLHPADSRFFVRDYRSLGSPQTSVGIGGESRTYYDQAAVLLVDAAGHTAGPYFIEIAIAEPTAVNQAFPSLLGRDILGKVRLVVDAARDRVTLE